MSIPIQPLWRLVWQSPRRLALVPDQIQDSEPLQNRYRCQRKRADRGQEPQQPSGSRAGFRQQSGSSQYREGHAQHGSPWLKRRMERWAERMGVEPKGVAVRDLGYRWGSCGHARRVNFHWATMLLPSPIVDYVIVHELAHLAVPNHGPAFWRRVGLALPEYEIRKAWLVAHGGQQVLKWLVRRCCDAMLRHLAGLMVH